MSDLKKYLVEAGVPESRHDEAIASLESAKKPAKKRFLFGLLAPLVWIFIGLFLPRKAEKLPKWLRYYDNNISINGDRADWEDLGAHLPPGERYRRLPALDKAVKDENGRSNSYFHPFSPRTWLPRWCFNGWRNRCGWLAKEWGKPIIDGDYSQGGAFTPQSTWGHPAPSRSSFGVRVSEHGGVWQIERTSPAKFGLVKTECYGYEIRNANAVDQFGTVAWTPVSYKTRKGD